MKALSRRLAAIERRQVQTQTHRLAWPSLAVAVAAGVNWPILVIGDVLPEADWTALAKEQQAELLRGLHDEKH